MKTYSSLLSVVLFSIGLLAGGAAVRGQSALDGFDPNANSAVFAVVAQPDGKVLIAGQFTNLLPNGGVAVTRNNIARLNPDGTLDTSFNPNANSAVRAIALQADGKIAIGGDFTTLSPNGGPSVARNFIARLNMDGSVDNSFDPHANASVVTLVVQANGKILAGGNFSTFFPGGPSITRNRIARINADGAIDAGFNPNANGEVLSIAVQTDGKVLAAGSFTTIGGAGRNRIARLDATTGSADSFDPNANSDVWSIAVQADGKILAGGSFNSFISTPTIGGQTRNRIARLDATTGLADTWNPSANNTVNSIAVQADGKVLVGGQFNGGGSVGGQTRNRFARLDAVTGLADSFDPSVSGGGGVNSIAVQPNGKILIGGAFTTLSPNGGAAVTRNCIARLETDGRLDQTLDLSTVGGFVFATAVQPDGKILIGGIFSTVLGVTRNNIARLNTDGTLDTVFDPNADHVVYAIAVQADGRILVGGGFSTLSPNGGGMVTRNNIARLNTDGTLDTVFNPDADSFVFSIVVQADGKILAGGQFTSIGGQTRNYIARLDATTGAADSFDPNANLFVFSIAVQADGKILAGGQFFGGNSIGGAARNRIARLDATTGTADSFDPDASDAVFSIAVQADGKILAGGQFLGANSIGGQTRNGIARLDSITGLADSFDPNASDAVFSIAVQADGKILAGGNFTSIGGQMRDRVARLDATTGSADSFDPNANGSVFSVAVQADGKILTGGNFNGANSIGGQARSLFARLSNDTAALQNLSVSQTTIIWTRGGSSPQLSRATFEDSTDNVSYTLLGNGTASGSNWTLTGLNLPAGQNFYIRARGCYRGGYTNGSESITESVRNAVVAGPSPTPTPTPRPRATPKPTPTSPTPTPTPRPSATPKH